MRTQPKAKSKSTAPLSIMLRRFARMALRTPIRLNRMYSLVTGKQPDEIMLYKQELQEVKGLEDELKRLEDEKQYQDEFGPNPILHRWLCDEDPPRTEEFPQEDEPIESIESGGFEPLQRWCNSSDQ